MATVLKGAPVAAAIADDLKERVAALAQAGVTPTLALVRVGERSDDLSYERGAVKRCDAVGVAVRREVLPADCTTGDLLARIDALNNDANVHGCLLFRPLPAHLDERRACAALASDKDVDCATDASLLGVLANRPVGFAPCTAEAVIALLDHYDVPLEGADVCVVGRSLVIGKPVAMMLQARNATVTMCHTRTRDLPGVCRRAQVLVVAAGHAKTVGAACASASQTVVDVGINWDEQASRLVGDVDFDEVEPLVAGITPVPGGIGAVTTAVLARHVVEAAERVASTAIDGGAR